MTEMKKRYSVWWIPQVPMHPFRVEVESPEQGAFLLKVLAEYDRFQYETLVKPDYSNAGGLDEWDEDAQEWITWYDEEGWDIDELMEPENTISPFCDPLEIEPWESFVN